MKNPLKISLIVLGITACLLLVGGIFYEKQFSLNAIKILYLKPRPKSLSVNEITHLKELIKRPYTYLDRGRQSFVFISEDKKNILKFFDARCLKETSFFSFPSKNDIARCQRKLKSLLDGYKIASIYDFKNSALIFWQLQPNPDIAEVVVVKDRFGLSHTIPLAQVTFVIQKVATPTRVDISNLLDKGNVEKAKEHLGMIVDMYLQEYSKGLYDTDHNFMYNTGFIEDQPVRIDLGRLKFDNRMKKTEFFASDLEAVAIKRLDGWLTRHYPKYRSEIMQYMKSKIALSTVITE